MKLFNQKQAQVNELFMYVVGIIMIGLILLFGVKYILKLRLDIESINLVQFKSEIEEATAKYTYQYGSYVEQTFSVPDEVTDVCFFDLSKLANADTSKICGGTSSADSNDVKKQLQLCDAWKEGEQGTQNVMTIPFVTETPIYIGKVQVDNSFGYKCFKVAAGKFTATITGLGDGIMVS